MPCLEISMPRVPYEVKARLADELTAAFATETGWDASIFGIRFLEYEPGQAALGGRISAEGTEKPYLHLLLYIPRISRTNKRKLVAAWSRILAEGLGHPEWLPIVHINEHPYDNVGVEGQLLSEKFEELGRREFYYPLPKD